MQTHTWRLLTLALALAFGALLMGSAVAQTVDGEPPTTQLTPTDPKTDATADGDTSDEDEDLSNVTVDMIPSKTFGELSFMVGQNWTDLDSFNNVLRQNGYSTFSDGFPSFGFGGLLFIDHFIVGIEGHWMDSKTGAATVNNVDYETKLSGGQWFINLGYLAHDSEDLRVYPLLGIGPGALDFAIKPPFDSILTNPASPVKLTKHNTQINLGVGATYHNWLGVRAGYIVPLDKGEWRANDVEVTGGPDASFQGPYVRLQFVGTIRPKVSVMKDEGATADEDAGVEATDGESTE